MAPLPNEMIYSPEKCFQGIFSNVEKSNTMLSKKKTKTKKTKNQHKTYMI